MPNMPDQSVRVTSQNMEHYPPPDGPKLGGLSQIAMATVDIGRFVPLR